MQNTQCQITECSAPYDQRHLWTCKGICKRSFHAACVGVKRGGETDLSQYMLPVCLQCRQDFLMEVDIRKILSKQLESSHFIQMQMKSTDSTTEEALNDIRTKLDELQTEVKNVRMSSKKIEHTMSASSQPEITINQIEKIIQDTTKSQNGKLAESFGRISQSMTAQCDDIMHCFSSIEKCPTDQILEIYDEVRALSSLINRNNNNNNTVVPHKSIAEEFEEAVEAETINNATDTKPGWRLLGNKKIWKPDWTEYDARQRTRRLQEKKADKARRRLRRQRHNIQQQYGSKINNPNQTNNSSQQHRNFPSSNSETTNQTAICSLMTDKQLLEKAKVEFSGQPPAPAPKFINFQKGETINPYRPEKTPTFTPSANVNTTPPQILEISDSMFELDPMKPPIVRLTEQSTNGDGRFLLARLRDSKIFENIRLHLAYLKDQPASVCIEGRTSTSMKAYLASEGLPTAPEHLLRILVDFNQSIGIAEQETHTDLEAYSRHIAGRRLHHLQQMRESANNFYRPTNFYKH